MAVAKATRRPRLGWFIRDFGNVNVRKGSLFPADCFSFEAARSLHCIALE